MREGRPSPDELLIHVQAEEQQQKQGRLTIFLGFAAGVGKTYAMLQAAQEQKEEIDLVVAYVETHGRAETEELLEGLPTVPPRQVDYRGITIPEMDLDAVLARKPQLALVDELAHTNASGSRHPKRYHDVEELLNAGIDVYTTLNIQHVESIRNTVAQITGVWVRETVPDTIIDRAYEIKLVDLPPDELIKRLKDGKVYVPEQIAHATADFFRKGNLSALREVALRVAAEQVERQTRSYMHTHAVQGPWPATEHVLACISPGPLSSRLLRSARRLASQLNGDWVAIYVETPDNVNLSSAKQVRLSTAFQLAKRLGADVVVVQGQSVAQAITEYAEAHDITKIVIGKSKRSRWQEFFFGSLVSRIIRQSRFIDVYVVGGKAEPAAVQEKEAGAAQAFNWRGYLVSLAMVVGVTLVGWLIRSYINPTNLIMVYLLCVVISAVYFGFGPSIAIAILSTLAFDFYLVPPVLTFAVADVQYLLTFVGLTSVGIVVSYLTARVRKQVFLARQRQVATATLYTLSREIAGTVSLEDTVRTINSYLKRTFGLETVILLPDSQNDGKLKPSFQKKNFVLDENEFAVATWAFQHQQAAGRGTDTLPDSGALFLPLNVTPGAVGVLGIWAAASKFHMPVEQFRLLEALADLSAVAIERAQMAEVAGGRPRH